MFSACRTAVLLLAGSAAMAGGLRVCADPDNLPYSNSREQGFENELARFVGRQLGSPIRYLWLPQHEKYFKALAGGACDLTLEAPPHYRGIRTTRPYYTSSYVFVARRDRALGVRSFDDPRLKTLRIGLQVTGADNGAAPPAEALSRRGMVRNVTFFRLYQSYFSVNRPAVLIDAVKRGDVDVAIAWGPLAGYFAKQSSVPLDIAPVSPRSERGVPFAFDIAMGVRADNAKLAAELDSIIERHPGEIRRVLRRFGVPLVEPAGR